MTATVRRITISLPKEQIKSIKNVSKILKTPVSTLVSELIGEAFISFEQLVQNRDFEGARQRIHALTEEAHQSLEDVEHVFNK